MPRELGIVTSALSLDLRDAVRDAKGLGFAGVQTDVTGSGVKDLSRTGQRELLKLLSGMELRLVSLGTTCGRAGISPGADVDRVIDHLDASLRAAAELGKAVLCVDLGPLPPAPAEEPPKAKPVDPILAGAILIPTAPVDGVRAKAAAGQPQPRNEAAESLLDAALAEVGKRADRYGVVVAFRSELGALASLHRALSAAACPLFTLDLDPVAVLREQGSGGWDLEATLGKFAGRVGHVRARDARLGAGGRTQPAPIGDGDTDFGVLLRSLDDAAYGGPIVVDPTDLRDRAGAAAAGLRRLREG